jgi:glycosyltransferase involved in cell wall biosynthesis
MPAALLIIPCYNEADRFPQQEIETFLAQVDDVALLLVNDGSADRTSEVLAALRQRWPEHVHVLELGQNAGKAEAIRQGVRSEVAQQAWHTIGYLDADLATPMHEIQRLLARFRSQPALRMLTGLRLARLGADVHRQPLRHYAGRVIATLISLILGLRVYDTQCGAKLLRAEDARALFAEPFLSKWLFDVELFARQLIRLGQDELRATTREEPLEVWIEKGDSRIKRTDLLRIPWDLFRIWRRYRGALRRAGRQ